KWEQRAVLMIRRAEKAQADMRLGLETLHQRRDEARLSKTGFAGEQHDLAVARFGARPAAEQQINPLVAADQRGQRRSAQCLRPACDNTWTYHLRDRHPVSEPLDLDSAKIAVLEKIADQPACAGRDDHRVRLGEGL